MTELITNCQVCGEPDNMGYCQKCLLIEKLDLEYSDSLANDDEDEKD